MKWFISNNRIIFVGLMLIILNAACLDKNQDELESEAQELLQTYLDENGYTEQDKIAYGVYMKIDEGTVTDGATPESGNTVLMELTGMYTDYTVFETTDVDQSASIANNDLYIYGPRRYTVGDLIVGLDTAIKFMSEGSEAQIVIPHTYAYGNYKPVVYNVKLLEVIEDDSTYEAETFAEYMVDNGFSDSMYIPNSIGLLYKLEEGDSLETDSVMEFNDTLVIELTARYAESYIGSDGEVGRVFYPRGTETTTISDYYWGNTSDYPIISAIDSATKYMRVGQTIDIAFKSGAEEETYTVWGYGTTGLNDSDINYYVISAYTPLHYTIKVVSLVRTD
jgi:FKBP-type peptidyl-prolyl cis-trans isomerase